MKRILMVLVLLCMAGLLVGCSGNKMVGKYKMTSMKVDGEEKATRAVLKAFEKEEYLYGSIEVKDKGKAILTIQGEDEMYLSWDEKTFTDEDDNDYKYTFEEDTLTITKKVDGVTTKMKFERLSKDDEEIDWIGNVASEKELAAILGIMPGTYKLTGLVMKMGDQEIDYMELAKSMGMDEDEFGFLEIIDDKNAVMRSFGDDQEEKLTFDDKYFYASDSWNDEKIAYKVSGNKITFTYEEDDTEMIMTFEK